jgi:hypothetical protein
VTDFEVEDPFSDPREQKVKRDARASRLLAQVFLDSRINVSMTALQLARGLKRLRQYADPSHPSTLPFGDLLGMPTPVLEAHARALLDALHWGHYESLDTDEEATSALDLAQRIQEATSAAVSQLLKHCSQEVVTKLDATAARKLVREAMGLLQAADLRLQKLEQGDPDNVRPIRNGERT